MGELGNLIFTDVKTLEYVEPEVKSGWSLVYVTLSLASI